MPCRSGHRGGGVHGGWQGSDEEWQSSPPDEHEPGRSLEKVRPPRGADRDFLSGAAPAIEGFGADERGVGLAPVAPRTAMGPEAMISISAGGVVATLEIIELSK